MSICMLTVNSRFLIFFLINTNNYLYLSDKLFFNENYHSHRICPRGPHSQNAEVRMEHAMI